MFKKETPSPKKNLLRKTSDQKPKSNLNNLW